MQPTFLNGLNAEMSQKFPLLQPISEIIPDGSIKRLDSTKANDKAVWLCVHQVEHKGNFYYNAVYGNWREGVQYTYSSHSRSETSSKEIQSKMSKTIKDTQERLEKEKQEKYKLCRDKWTPFFYGLPVDTGLHPYLKNKKIDSNYHARVTEKNVLFVPAWNCDGIFVGGQRIFLDPETEKYEKRYTYGIEKKGSFCPFGNIRTAEFVYILEGFATAASVYMAFKKRDNIAVIAAWDTSNLLTAAKAIRKINPNSYLIFGADRDIHHDPKWHNIGEKKAKQAASKISNAIVKTVQFNNQNDKWSDYNDLHNFEGLDQVIKQLHVENTDFIEIIPLGFDEDSYYYFASHKKQILKFTNSSHNPNNFLLNAPAKYWGDRYGYVVKQDGTLSSSPNWKMVIEKLGLESAKAGVFNNKKVRGLGAWSAKEGVIVNLGDKLYCNGEFLPLFNNGLKDDFFYQSNESIPLDFTRPLGGSDCIKIVEAFQMLRYKNPTDYIIVLGWIFAAQVFATLPWRPHIWFTGSRGSGKSHILGYVNDAINFSILIQDSTASGIRQRLKNNAMAVIYDETEPNTEKERDRMSEVLALSRQSSTKGKYESLRGSSSGKAISYNTNTAFCMGSIQLSEMGGADVSRFFVIEMDTVKDQTPDEFVRLQNSMAEVSKLSSMLFVRAVNMQPTLLANIEKTINIIKRKRIEARQADQLAPIIAGYYAYFYNGEITEEFVINTISELDFKNSDYAKANEENDPDRCLQDILELQIPGRTISVGQIVERYPYEQNRVVKDEYDQLLGLIGIRVIVEKGETNKLFISSSSSALRKQLERFSKYSDYKNVLKRNPAYIGSKAYRVSGKSMRGIILEIKN